MAEGHASRKRREEPQVPDWIGGALEYGAAAARRPAASTPEPRRERATGRAQAARVAPRGAHRAVPGVANRRLLLIATSLLLLYGLVMAYSASTAQAYFTYGSSYYFLKKQVLFAAVGVAVMLCLSRIDYALLRRFAWPLAAIVAFLLVLALVPGIGIIANGARRWLDVGGQTVQPSEFAKLAAVILAAALAVQRPRELKRFGRFAMVAGAGIVPFGLLIMLGKDLSTTLVLIAGVAAVLVVADARWRHLLVVAAAMPVVVGLLILAEPYRQARLVSFLDPWKDAGSTGFQATQALISVASGHLFGVGLGDSVQKFGFLPEQTTDMITGIIGEELGLLGLAVLMAIYVLLVWAGLRIALSCREPFGKYAAVGVTAIVGIQALLNLGAALGLLPILGVPLPLVSCGGTSLVTVLAGIGILLNVATNRRSHIGVTADRRVRVDSGGRDGRPHGARPRGR